MFLRFYHQRYPIFTIACCTSLNSITSELLKIRSNNFVNSYDNYKPYFAFKTWLLGFMLLFLFSNAECLTVKTVNVITGNAPYLSFDGRNRALNTEPLLWLRLSNGLVYQPYQDRSNYNNPIKLPESVAKVKDIQTIVPFNNYPSISLSNIIATNNYFNDIDGDSGISSSGTLNVTWRDVNNNDITNWVKNNQDAFLSITGSPYKVTISSTSGRLSTRYGLPQSSDISNFQGASHTYYFSPEANGRAIKTRSDSWEYPVNRNKWNNFPTTGGDGLNYTLVLDKISPEEVIAINGSIIYPESGEGVNLSLWRDSINEVGIRLNGPKIINGGRSTKGVAIIGSDKVDKKFGVSRFVLYADKERKTVLYKFIINTWFINTNRFATNQTQTPIRPRYCNYEGYDLPSIALFSNFYSNRPTSSQTFRELGRLYSEWGQYVGSWKITDRVMTSGGGVIQAGVIQGGFVGERLRMICATRLSPKN